MKNKESFEQKKEVIEACIIPSIVTETVASVIPPLVIPPSFISLRIFEYVCGLKKDQIAGFMYHAKQNKFDNLTILQWQEKVKQFNDKVVR